MKQDNKKVSVWEEQVTLPTYGIGKADKNPMFFEKRVYQGSSGKVYPFPVIDKIYDEKTQKEYKAVYLENDYLKVMILPELGGRIQRAFDKTNQYDFVYYNEVIKPALVGLTGPWISGGIEFNWPQHHRPTTFAPVDYILKENEDGSKTVCVSEVDQMYGTKGMASFTLYPDKAYIEIKGQLYNRTNMPQTFLWWANPAVAVNDNTQSIFPPDVHAVMDHGKRDVSSFPIATGVYYKHDYSAGVDISRYKNIPVPTSYMAYHSDYNFVGGYDHQLEAGILHIADHHVSPGKKQWTWGNGDFGKAWDRNLTDDNGPYIELMTGIYTDNQPDFTWLKPFEEKTFTQFFMPYKKIANVKNASTEIVLNLETSENTAGGTPAESTANVRVYATAVYEDARIVLAGKSTVYLDLVTRISPVDIVCQNVEIDSGSILDLTLSVYDVSGRLMLDYTTVPAEEEAMPLPLAPAQEPGKITSCEELYLTGQHIEQYRHATYEPDGYYLEGLVRDSGDIRLNMAYGTLLLRRGQFAASESFFRKAIERLTWKNPNPYDSEAYYCLGLSLWYQGKEDTAFDAFYKAIWTSAQQEMSFYYMAAISSRKGKFEEALQFIDRSLVKNGHSLKSRAFRAVLLRKLGHKEEAKAYLLENLALDAFDYVSRLELAADDGGSDELAVLMGGRESSYIESAADYAEGGFYEEAIRTLRLCNGTSPMLKYYEAFYSEKCAGIDDGKTGTDKDAANINTTNAAAARALIDAAARSPLYCFPNRSEDILVLEYAVRTNPLDSRAPYYLGNLLYDRKQYEKAQTQWETSLALDPAFPTAWRNLSLALYNKAKLPVEALAAMAKAFALDTTDARVFLELDQLHKKLGVTPAVRLENYETYKETFLQRDDLYAEYVTLLNLLGRHTEAYELIMQHKFHPWEGGEGRITGQYTIALSEMARAAISAGDAEQAKDLLEKALTYPENLGEGKLEGVTDNNLYYYLGFAEEMMGNSTASEAAFERAAIGDEEPAGSMFYNDQPADMILYQGLAHRKLGREEDARRRFHTLLEYGENHISDTVKMDYFAVSLPDLQLFDEDLSLRNRANCQYLIGLACYALDDISRAESAYRKTLEIDCAHMGATLHLKLI